MVRENSVTVQNVRLEMSRRLHRATDVTPETISPRRLRGVGKEYFVCNLNEPVVAVRVFYVGVRTARQAFMSMLIEKLKSQRKAVDIGEPRRYNKANPNRGVHGGNGESP